MGSIPDSVIGILHWRNPSGCTMALGLTQPLTEMSTRNISWGGKGSWCIGLTTLTPSCADCLEIWNPHGLPRPVMGLLYLSPYLCFQQKVDIKQLLYNKHLRFHNFQCSRVPCLMRPYGSQLDSYTAFQGNNILMQPLPHTHIYSSHLPHVGLSTSPYNEHTVIPA